MACARHHPQVTDARICRDARGYDDGASVQWRGCKRPI
jgi:hypothetical protein